jgi:LPS export ABC transporter protein LptC
MRRKQLRALLLVVVVGAIGLVGYQTVRTVALRKLKQGASALGEKLKTEVAQQMKHFKRIKLENGRTVWVIEAEEAEYRQAANEVVVRHPKVTVHLQDGAHTAIIAGTEGTITLDGQEVKHVELHGTVTITYDDLELRTEVATYDQVNDIVRAPGAVSLKGPDVEMRATGMEVDVQPQRVRLLADVHTVLRSRDAAT